MEKNSKKTWQEIVNENYYSKTKQSAAMKSDGTPFLGKAQLYLKSGTWVDRYNARVQGLELDENSARQVPKARAGYSTLYRVKVEKPAQKKQGLKDLLKQLQTYTGKKGRGEVAAQKAQSLLKGIKKDLTEEEGIALNHYLAAFYSVVITEEKKVALEAAAKAAKVGYGIVTAEAKAKAKKGGK